MPAYALSNIPEKLKPTNIQPNPEGQKANEEKIAALKKMSRPKKILYIVLAVIVLALLVQYLNAAKYQALVQVIKEDKIGVNPTGLKLDFGDLPRDKSSTRIVNLVNNSPYKASSYIMVWKFGDISEIMKVNKNYFTLKPHTSEKLEFTVYVPNSAEYRYYTGRVIIFQIPKIW